MHDVARTEAGGEHRARRDGEIDALPLRLEDRTGRHVQALGLAGRRDVEAAERRRFLLQGQQIGFAQERQLGEC